MARNEIERWYDSYRRDFASSDKEIDDWYEAYRRDFLPKRFGGSGVDIKGYDVAKCTNPLFRDLVLVGRGEVTNDKCGTFGGFFGCVQHEKHAGGGAWVMKYFYSCDKPSCPKCYRSGWAVKEAGAIESRMSEASKMFGLPVEHIVCSLPESNYDLTYKEAKRKCIEVLASRGIKGGILIPHGNRVDRHTRVESYSPHFHALTFIEGGYERCRNCERKWNCLSGCGGFDDRNHRLSLMDGYVIKVLAQRKTIGGTAWYQLHHSSTNPFKKRSRVATYFGCCGYNNLRAKVVKRKYVCPSCGSPCGFINYVGSKRIVTDRRSPDFRSKGFETFFEDGNPAWVVKEIEDVKGGDVL